MSKTLIAFFSRAGYNYAGGSIVHLNIGNTEVAAEKIGKLTGGDMFRIDPVKPYPDDYNACTEIAKTELHAKARPAIKSAPESIDMYDTVVLAYPSWWGTIPMAVATFLEKYSFAGKKILPVCTNEGSGMGSSEQDIRKLCPGCELKKGLSIRGSDVSESDRAIKEWLENNI